MELNNFAKLVNDKCGLVISEGQFDTLNKAINSRMSKSGIKSQSRYYESLLNNIDETHNLIDLLTINETHFFREKIHYDLLANRILPDLLRRKKTSGEKINILSAGCSSGEEPYTLAILLCEKYGPDKLKSVSITGWDINQNVLGKARRGVYGNHSFRGCEKNIRDQYFKPVQGEWQQHEIRDDIKQAVTFQRVNLLSGSYPDTQQTMDIIFYRNVSIYFKRDIQTRIFKSLSGLLNENGYIFTSSTETYLHNVGILFLTECEGIFLYRKKVTLTVDDRRNYKTHHALPVGTKAIKPALALKKSTTKSSSRSKPPSPQTRKTTQLDVRSKTICQDLFDKALYDAMATKHASALDYIDTLIKIDPSIIKAYNLKTSILINLKRFEDARKTCSQTLNMDEWNLECLLLLGITAKIEGNLEEALGFFKKAIYIQPDCWLAHFYMGEIQNFNGVTKIACREYGIALKLIEKQAVADHGITYFPIACSVDQLIHLCKNNISAMNKTAECSKEKNYGF